MNKLTTQDIIDIAVDLYENRGFTRQKILVFLQAVLDHEIATFDIDRIFDLVVG